MTTPDAAMRQHSDSPNSRAPVLTPEAIVDHALELTEREGPAALSLRRLGQEMGVNATAFYRHFRDKDDLVLACMDRIIVKTYDAIADDTRDLDWPDLLRAAAQASHDMSITHPAIYALAFARTTGGPGERQMIEMCLARLSRAGMSREQTVLCYRTFVDTMLAMCGMNATLRGLGPELAAKDASAWTRIYAVLPEEEFPVARAHSSELGDVTDKQIYAKTIDLLIEGIEAMAAAARRTGSPA